MTPVQHSVEVIEDDFQFGGHDGMPTWVMLVSRDCGDLMACRLLVTERRWNWSASTATWPSSPAEEPRWHSMAPTLGRPGSSCAPCLLHEAGSGMPELVRCCRLPLDTAVLASAGHPGPEGATACGRC
jgi:hypothetical protein